MKSWFAFGFGLVIGGIASAFLVTFLLYDEVIKGRPPSVPAASVSWNQTKGVTIRTKKVEPKEVEAVSSQPPMEVKPFAITAEGVNPDSLSDEGVLATAKRDEITSSLTQ